MAAGDLMRGGVHGAWLLREFPITERARSFLRILFLRTNGPYLLKRLGHGDDQIAAFPSGIGRI